MYCYNENEDLDLSKMPVEPICYDEESGDGFEEAMDDAEANDIAEQLKILQNIPEEERDEEDNDYLKMLQSRLTEITESQHYNPGFRIITPNADGHKRSSNKTPEDPAF